LPEVDVRVRSTTVVCVRRDGKVAMGADGQVTMDKVVLKHGARKLRRLGDGQVLAGFAGATADAFTLFEKFEGKLKEYGKNLPRDRSARRHCARPRASASTPTTSSPSRSFERWPSRAA